MNKLDIFSRSTDRSDHDMTQHNDEMYLECARIVSRNQKISFFVSTRVLFLQYPAFRCTEKSSKSEKEPKYGELSSTALTAAKVVR